MGGFTLFDGERSLGTLARERMKVLLDRKRINFPQITAEEIQDHSKNDALAKLLAVGQTSWFLLQVIARRASGLAITELEIATAAFSVLSAMMYFFWWNKPFDIRTSVPVYLLEGGLKLPIPPESCKSHEQVML